MNYITIANDFLTNFTFQGYFLIAWPGIAYAVAGFGFSFFVFLIVPSDVLN